MRVGLSEEGRERKWLIWELAQRWGGASGNSSLGTAGVRPSSWAAPAVLYIPPGTEACPTPPSGSVGTSTPPAQGCRCWWHGARALGGVGLGGGGQRITSLE